MNPYSIRIRILDPDFRGLDRVELYDLIWDYLDRSLVEDLLQLISYLLLLTPTEAKSSFGNRDFEDPIPYDI